MNSQISSTNYNSAHGYRVEVKVIDIATIVLSSLVPLDITLPMDKIHRVPKLLDFSRLIIDTLIADLPMDIANRITECWYAAALEIVAVCGNSSNVLSDSAFSGSYYVNNVRANTEQILKSAGWRNSPAHLNSITWIDPISMRLEVAGMAK